MLRALARDPLVIKGSRVDTLYGLVDLMDAALASIRRMDLPTLYLYGDRDEIVPRRPTELAIRRLLANARARDRDRIAFYTNGWHMLLRDLEGPAVSADVAGWVLHPEAPLASGADRGAVEAFSQSSRQLSQNAP
jgi:alpha-beta hydrolase superfamily lysophospholipase